MLKISPTKTDPQAIIAINSETVKSVCFTCYLGDHFNVKMTTKNCAQRDAQEVVFGIKQIKVMLLLYRFVFLPRLLCNCEAWSSNLSRNNIVMSQSIPTGYTPPGNPGENFFERANAGHPEKFFCLILCPGAKNDGRIPWGGAKFSQTRRNCSVLKLAKSLKD